MTLKRLYNHLVFALKYEGINLLLFSCLTKHYSEAQLCALVSYAPTGQYSRRIWFILEWLLGRNLEGKEGLSKKGYIPLVDTKQQYAVAGTKSPRHLVINNLPGTPAFCPLIKKSEKLEEYINSNLLDRNKENLKGRGKEILQRASSFLLLKDSKASFSIEGESPKSKRAARWSQAIGQAGAIDLSESELLRLQQVVIENTRFVGYGISQKRWICR